MDKYGRGLHKQWAYPMKTLIALGTLFSLQCPFTSSKMALPLMERSPTTFV
jgi:hypothetical protein